MARASVSEIIRCLVRDLGRRKGAEYARRIEGAGGEFAGDYGEAADVLEEMARTREGDDGVR